jgi:Rrf2 family protein
MFKISRRFDYGLQVMLALVSTTDQPVATATLSRQLDIPLPFMHQIIHTLMQKGLIRTTPGPRGGIRLNRDPSTISVREIMEALEGPIRLSPCLEDPSACPRQDTCVFMPIWASLQKTINETLEGLTLDNLAGHTPQSLLGEMQILNVSVGTCQPTTVV